MFGKVGALELIIIAFIILLLFLVREFKKGAKEEKEE
jgi:Sec-independent protein translocase protein TatA